MLQEKKLLHLKQSDHKILNKTEHICLTAQDRKQFYNSLILCNLISMNLLPN